MKTIKDFIELTGILRETLWKWKKEGRLDGFLTDDGVYDYVKIADNLQFLAKPSVIKRAKARVLENRKEKDWKEKISKEHIRSRIKICDVCNIVFLSSRSNQVFCSNKCAYISEWDFNVIGRNSYWVKCARCKSRFNLTSWTAKDKSERGQWKCVDCRRAERIKRCPICGRTFYGKGGNKKFCSHRCACINVYVPKKVQKKRISESVKIKSEKERRYLGDNYIKKLLTDKRIPNHICVKKVTPEIINMKRDILTVKRKINDLKEVLK